MSWELIEVANEPMWHEDNSGLYVTVHRIEEKAVHKGHSGVRIGVRVDLMRKEGDDPVRSWIGHPDAVRKALMQWIDNTVQNRGVVPRLSCEHAAYIGAEIQRASVDPNYVQK